MARIAVVGSLNYDITVWVPRRPGPDETLFGDRVAEFAGGKGANQAVAASRLGASVTMIGCVGDDARGRFLTESAAHDGVDVSAVAVVGEPTGVAVITVDPDDVSIVVVPGANGVLDPAGVERNADAIADADVLLLQGESPPAAAGRAARIARDNDTTVVFNPAPVNDVVDAVLDATDVLIVNRVEAGLVDTSRANVVLTTLGADGCRVRVGTDVAEVAAHRVEVVDPTGAGDCFAAAVGVALAEGSTPVEAARFASAAGAEAVTVAGAQPGMPAREVVEARLRG